MPTTRRESIAAADGDFDGHLLVPDAGAGPGIVLIQEVFGVNDYLLLRAEELAELGYTVLCPDMFWRIERNVSLPHDDDSLQQAFGYVQRFASQIDAAIADLGATLDRLRILPETTSKTGVMGFCLGGSLAYLTAAHHEPDSCVAYYGSMIPDHIDLADRVTCPMLLHWGGSDPFIPMEQIEKVRAALDGRPDVEFHVQEQAGHAFDNELAPQFHDPAAREATWPITVDFLERTLSSP